MNYPLARFARGYHDRYCPCGGTVSWWPEYGYVCDEEDDVPLRTYTRTGLRIRRLWLWWRGFLAPPQTKVDLVDDLPRPITPDPGKVSW